MWKKCCIFAHSWRYLITFQLFNSLKLNHNNTPVGFCYSPSCKICISIFYSPHTRMVSSPTPLHAWQSTWLWSQVYPVKFYHQTLLTAVVIFAVQLFFVPSLTENFMSWNPLKTLLNMPMPLAGRWMASPKMFIVDLLTEWHKASHSHK